jgi:hypothetical protein
MLILLAILLRVLTGLMIQPRAVIDSEARQQPDDLARCGSVGAPDIQFHQAGAATSLSRSERIRLQDILSPRVPCGAGLRALMRVAHGRGYTLRGGANR